MNEQLTQAEIDTKQFESLPVGIPTLVWDVQIQNTDIIGNQQLSAWVYRSPNDEFIACPMLHRKVNDKANPDSVVQWLFDSCLESFKERIAKLNTQGEKQ